VKIALFYEADEVLKTDRSMTCGIASVQPNREFDPCKQGTFLSEQAIWSIGRTAYCRAMDMFKRNQIETRIIAMFDAA